MDVTKCTVCNIKIDEGNYKKGRKICKNRCNNNRKKYNINTFFRNDNDREKGKVVNSVKNTKNNKKKTKVVDPVNKNNNQTLISEFLKCSKTYLMNHILLQKQELIFIITKSLNQYPNINAQTSDEIQPLEKH